MSEPTHDAAMFEEVRARLGAFEQARFALMEKRSGLYPRGAHEVELEHALLVLGGGEIEKGREAVIRLARTVVAGLPMSETYRQARSMLSEQEALP